MKSYLEPILLIEGAGDDASFKEDDDSFEGPVGDLVVEVILPVLQL